MSTQRSILFVCTANQCRSPMAEAILRDYLTRMNPKTDWKVKSAGTWAENGKPATTFGIKAMADRGLVTSGHLSQPVTQELLDQFDLILTMETGHKEAIQIEFPETAHKVFLLSEMSDEIVSIKDPVGGSFEDYLNTAREIEGWIVKGIPKIFNLLGYPE